MARTWNLSILLLKEGHEDPAAVFGSRVEGLVPHAVAAGETTGTLYVTRGPNDPPEWTKLFDDESTTPPLDLRRPTFGAVLLLQAAGRWFAVTFGTGRHLLETACYEKRFGLKAALNVVEPSALRSAQSRVLDDSALHVHRQSSRLNDMVGLDVDMDRDLLVNLAGITAEGEVGKRISGSDAARLTDKFDLEDLSSRCADLLKASERTTYRKSFAWVDKIEPLQDAVTVTKLNDAVAERLLGLDLAGVDVYPPELVDHTVVAFRTPTASTVMEPDPVWLRSLIEHLGESDATTLRERLERLSLKAVDDNGDLVRSWPVWECLYVEAEIDDETHVLDRGEWFRVQRSFAAVVNEFVADLRTCGLSFPAAKFDESEGAYNARIAAPGSGLTLADKSLVQPVPGETRIEVCDLIGPDGQMIHVKRRKGGSGPLSHLFGQALVSGQLFAREPAYVDQVRKMLAKQGYALAANAKPADHPIVLALMMSKLTGKQGNLPFFSKVNLREQVRLLRTAGFDVFLDEIEAPVGQTGGKAATLPTRGRPRRPKP